MPPTQPPLSTILPPLICGTATFNSQFNPDPYALPTNQIIARALDLGLRAFDTSPYYGPSEDLLGAALSAADVRERHPRSSYFLITKCGRIGGSEFDYSPEWVRSSVQRSLQRLRTHYLDAVYCHDVEFVTPAEVLEAVRELRRIRDTTGSIKYVGISGYPVLLLCELAELVLRETGEPLDVVQSYANFTVQNTTLQTLGLERLRKAGVSVVPNASVLGMGLLRGQGVPVGGDGDFHPAPRGLRQAAMDAARLAEAEGEKLEVVAIRWGFDQWARAGSSVGGLGAIGVSVIGVSNLSELEQAMKVWNSVLDGLPGKDGLVDQRDRTWSIERSKYVQNLAEKLRQVLGAWRDYAWASPDKDYVNIRLVKGLADQVTPGLKADVSKASRL